MAEASTRTAAPHRSFPPPACCFNPTCTVAVVATVAGVRAYELHNPGPSALPPHPLATSLAPPPAAPQPQEPLSAAAADTTSPASGGTLLWRTPVYTATVAGESRLLAVVFRARPPVFVAPTYTMNSSASGAAEPPSAHTATHLEGQRLQQTMGDINEEVEAAGEKGRRRGELCENEQEEEEEEDERMETEKVPQHTEETAAPLNDTSTTSTTAANSFSPVPSSVSASAAYHGGSELFASEAEYRRYVYLFDAATGVCLASLHFCGSPVLALRANAAVLLVAAVDLFHLVELRTLRYVRQQSMFKPTNPRSIIDLSAAVDVTTTTAAAAAPLSAVKQDAANAAGGEPTTTRRRAAQQFTYTVVFPQSARGYQGDVTALTLCTAATQPSGQAPSAAEAAAAAVSQPEHPRDAASPAGTSPTTTVLQHTIAAHHHAIAHLRLRPDGRLVVTASELASTLKVFDCRTGALLIELQRGHRPASVLAVGMQLNGRRIAALSTSGTLHVFDCAAVVQAWESPPRQQQQQLGMPSTIQKVRAAQRMKVTPLHSIAVMKKGGVGTVSTTTAARKTGGGAAGAASGETAGAVSLPVDGSIQHEVSFATDGTAVWVAQVESTETQRLHTTSSALRGEEGAVPGRSTRCVGRLTCFPLGVLPGHGAAQATDRSASFSVVL